MVKVLGSVELLLVAACAATTTTTTPTSTSTPTPTSTATSASTSTPTRPLTPGSVSVGEIAGPPSFDPKPALTGAKPALLACYTESRTLTPALHGKLTLQLRVNEAGAVVSTEASPGGQANDPGLLACIGDALKSVTFPKPGGTAVITVPLVFRQ